MNAILGDTIDKIFFRESLKILFFVSFLIFSLDLLLNFVKELEDLNSNYSFLEILQYIFYISLSRLCEILPLCAVISAILTFGFLNDSGELIAAQILGKSIIINVINILKPIIIFLIVTLLCFEFITPKLEILAKNIKFKDQETTIQSKWLQKNNVLANYSFQDNSGSDIKLYFLNEDKRLKSIIEAKSFEIQEEKWELNDAYDSIKNENYSEFYWEEGPSVGINEDLGIKELPLSQVYKILTQTGPEREKKKISYEFWKKLLEPLSAVSIIILSIALSILFFEKNKNLERLLFGSLMAFGFNLILKILGNIAIINNISPGLAILIPSLLVGLIGLKLLRI